MSKPEDGFPEKTGVVAVNHGFPVAIMPGWIDDGRLMIFYDKEKI